MESIVEDWKTRMTNEIKFVCTNSPSVCGVGVTPYKNSSLRGQITLRKLVKMISDSALSLVRDVTSCYWKRFEWLTTISKKDEVVVVDCVDRVRNSLLLATNELMQARLAVEKFCEIFLDECVPFYRQSMTPANARHLVYTLNFMVDEMWHLVVIGNCCFQSLSGSSLGPLYVPNLWKTMIGAVFSQNFSEYLSNPESYSDSFASLVESLRKLNLMRFCEDVLSSFLFKRITSKVKKTCECDFQGGLLDFLLDWMSSTCFSWLEKIFLSDLDSSDLGIADMDGCSELEDEEWILQLRSSFSVNNFVSGPILNTARAINTTFRYSMENWKSRLEYHLMVEFVELRIGGLFEIIIGYPATKDALPDLKFCLEKTNKHADLVNTLKSVFKTRLLHPGAYTQDILTAFILTIKVVNELGLDSTLLGFILEDVKTYLRGRQDFLRVVVDSLTDESSSSLLYNELVDGLADSGEDGIDSGEEVDREWVPKLAIVRPEDVRMDSNIRSGFDNVISNIIGIYGNGDVFASTYAGVLSERLLGGDDFSVEREVRYVELLKLKFGEGSFHYCEIMLKDVSDSKRLFGRIMEKVSNEKGGLSIFNAMIISYLFWPDTGVCQAVLPAAIEEERAKFTACYELLKSPRKLEWCDCVGVVELELEFQPDGDQKSLIIEYRVTPLQAAVICAFQEKMRWSWDELLERIQVAEKLAKQAVEHWCNLGILERPTPDTYQVVEMPNTNSAVEITEENVYDGPDDEDETTLELMVLSMLKNLGPLPLTKIHSMAQTHLGIEKTMAQMNEYLQKLLKQEKIELKGSVFSLATTRIS